MERGGVAQHDTVSPEKTAVSDSDSSWEDVGASTPPLDPQTGSHVPRLIADFLTDTPRQRHSAKKSTEVQSLSNGSAAIELDDTRPSAPVQLSAEVKSPPGSRQMRRSISCPTTRRTIDADEVDTAELVGLLILLAELVLLVFVVNILEDSSLNWMVGTALGLTLFILGISIWPDLMSWWFRVDLEFDETAHPVQLALQATKKMRLSTYFGVIAAVFSFDTATSYLTEAEIAHFCAPFLTMAGFALAIYFVVQSCLHIRRLRNFHTCS